MSSFNTNPWSNFCDPHWELINRNKWHPGTSEISTPLEIAVNTSMREHGTKTTPVFLLADGEASWLQLPSSVSLLSGGTVQLENTYSCILKVTGQVWESQKRISIDTNEEVCFTGYIFIKLESYKQKMINVALLFFSHHVFKHFSYI